MHNKLLLWVLCMLGLSSCVGKKKYVKELKLRQYWEDQANAIADELKASRLEDARQRSQLSDISYRLDQLKADSLQNSLLIAAHQRETKAREAELVDCRQELDSLLQIAPADPHLVMAGGAAEDLLREVESSLKNRLRQYSTSEISYVLAAETLRMTFSDSLLFQRASLQLNRRGLQSIGALSLVLKKYPQLEVIVVGHTDNRPVRRTNIRDNWDLSALRASTIVRILHRDFKLSAKRLTIQARGQFDQLTTGDDASARAQNRRTEIVLLCPPPTEAKTPKP